MLATPKLFPHKLHIACTLKHKFLTRCKGQRRTVQRSEVNKNDSMSVFEGRNADRSHTLAVTPCGSVELVGLEQTVTVAIR